MCDVYPNKQGSSQFLVVILDTRSRRKLTILQLIWGVNYIQYAPECNIN